MGIANMTPNYDFKREMQSQSLVSCLPVHHDCKKVGQQIKTEYCFKKNANVPPNSDSEKERQGQCFSASGKCQCAIQLCFKERKAMSMLYC
jgi:hypothetical protein